MICIREGLNYAVIGDGKGLMTPFFSCFNNVFDIRNTIHITHLGMAVQLDTLGSFGVYALFFEGWNGCNTGNAGNNHFLVVSVLFGLTFELYIITIVELIFNAI